MIKKKILMVGPLPPTVGGITTYIQILLKSNLNQNFNFIPFTTSRPTIGIIKDIYDYKLIFYIGFNNLLKSVLVTLQHIIKFPIILFFKKIEIVHIHTTDYWSFWENTLYVLMSKLFRKKIILHIHATAFNEFYNTGNRLVKNLIRTTLINSNKIIILSSRLEKTFIRLVSKNKLAVLPNVVIFNNFKIKSKNSKNRSEIIKVLFIGGEEAKRKGIYDIIKAIPIVIDNFEKNILFIFMGRCDIKKLSLICIKTKISNYVKFLDYVEEPEKIKILNLSDIFVLPSYAEGLPIAILEAMASGLPIISTFVGSIPNIIEEGINGFLIEPGNYLKLAEKIIKLSRDEKLRIDMGVINKQKIIDKYDVKILSKKLIQIYNEVR